MNIDVDCGRINLQEQATNGVAPFHQGGVVTLQQREVQPTVLHGASVDEQVLLIAGGSRYSRRADKAPHPQGAQGGRHGRRDRKSTRLNSSHPSTSYTVFRLKK